MKTCFAALLALSIGASALAQDLSPPVAERRPKDVSVHGDPRIDDYFWLREQGSPAVQAHLNAEAAYTAQWFAPLARLKARLYEEMLGRIQQSDEAVPVREGRFWYSTRTAAGAQYPIHIRRAASGPERAYDALAPEQVMLDMNMLARTRKFLAVSTFTVSPDGRRLLYALDETGARDFQLLAKDIASGQALPLKVEKTVGAVWAGDSQTLFYLTANAAKRSNRLWRHRIGQRGPDVLLYEEKDELFNLMDLDRSADGRILSVSSTSKDSTEVRLIDAARPLSAWRVVLPRRPGIEYAVEHLRDRLVLRINDRGPNFRIASIAAAARDIAAGMAHARELVAHRDDVTLEAMTLFKTHLVLQERAQGAITLRVIEHASGASRQIAFDEAVYAASLGQLDQNTRQFNREFDARHLRFDYQSLSTPPSVFDVVLASGERTLRKRQTVLGGYDPARYESKRIWTTAADGTQVPISLVYAKALRKPGPQSTLLYGYGSYGLPSDPNFSAARISLLDRGVVFAIAHVRGGGDLGRRWYDEGKLANKMNTFTDFISAAEALMAQGFTTPQQLIIQGGSAGGLLMGAVTNLRPELFKAVVAEVPFVDVINTMLDETIPLTTEEFIEWGNPKIAEQYRWMRAYSPYDNLRASAYPPLLARTALNDSQVPYWEAAKYVARLRAVKTDANPVLFDINMFAGHGGASGRFDALNDRAQVFAFMLKQWGLADAPP